MEEWFYVKNDLIAREDIKEVIMRPIWSRFGLRNTKVEIDEAVEACQKAFGTICFFIGTRDLIQEHVAFRVWPLVESWEMLKETITKSSEGELVRLKYTFRYGDKFDEPNNDWLKCIEATSDELLGAAWRKCALAEANREASEYWRNYLEKTVAELRASKERCFKKSLSCVEKIKASFANVGTYSNEDNFIRGDPEGVIEWISGEAEAFEEILSDRGDVCAFSGARRISAILEKAGCDHVKTLAQAEAAFSVDDTKDPSAEASLIGRKFYTDIWANGGREMAHEIMKKSEKDIHDAREAAKKAEEAAECERRIGIVLWPLASSFAFVTSN
jgi:hypothetical protein